MWDESQGVQDCLPPPHIAAVPCCTSAPLLQLHFYCSCHQAALLLNELTEGAVQGSLIVRARLLAARAQS